MTRSKHHMERLQQALAQGAERARRLAFLLRHPFDEAGCMTALALPRARKLVEVSLIEASDAAADLGCELGDIRWTGIVALLHSASQAVPQIEASEAEAAGDLLERLRGRTQQLRNARAGAVPTVRLFG